ncbi:MAG: potassium transporter TrkA [Thermoleophilia bacterium]|jgi:TrkA domain protein|nr:potassium transporter TrkA [Thermoleophilia bacterium]
MGISESELPGIGRRYELDVQDRDRIVTVVHNNGRRDLYAFGPGGGDPRGSTRLDDDSARQLGAILAGNYYRPTLVDPVAAIIDQFSVTVVEVLEGSRLAGHTIADLQLRERTGVTIVAAISGAATVLDPAPSTVVLAGDCIVVVGQPQDHARFALLAHPPEEAAQ